MAAVLDGEEVVAHAGDLVFKPRGQWHTFWNPGDTPTRVLEIIAPAGLEQLSRSLGALEEPPTPERLAELAAEYGADVDLEATLALVERHRLSF